MSASDKASGPNSAPDEVRQKFREALARKQGKSEQHDEGKPSERAESHTGPAKVQRTFRRKSG